jgi:hypothetical protein
VGKTHLKLEYANKMVLFDNAKNQYPDDAGAIKTIIKQPITVISRIKIYISHFRAGRNFDLQRHYLPLFTLRTACHKLREITASNFFFLNVGENWTNFL